MTATERVDLEPAFLIHRRAYQETSALLELFTRDHGRVAVVARGARRPRSALRPALRAFVPLLVAWSARGDLGTLRAVETPVAAVGLEGTALLSGLYINELVMRLTHRHDPHPELFDAYAHARASLQDGGEVEDILRVFEKRLLDAIGYGMLLDREAGSGAPVVREERYCYRADVGPGKGPARAGEAVEVGGATLLALAEERPLQDPVAQREAKRLMRFVINRHLGGRPLASRGLFRALDG